MVIKFNAEVIGREVLINGMENMGLSGEKNEEITKLISFKEKLLKNTVGAVTDAGNRRTRVNSLFIVLWRNFPNGSSNSNWVIDVQDCYVLEVQRRSSGLSLSNWVRDAQKETFW